MESLGKLNINSSDFEKIKCKKIGEGNDAIVYNAGKGNLYKVYKEESMFKNINKPTKIYKKGNRKKNIEERILYLDKDGVKIYYKDAFKRIVKKQDSINLSSLPKSSLYINGKFSGCVLKKINGVSIHNIFGILSKKTKLKILKSILEEVKELTDNFIYPIDIANSPWVGKHSNILINFKLKPELIDLDGNSTLYRECYDETCYNYTIASLNLLFLELINDTTFAYYDNSIDKEFLKNKLMKNGINEELAIKLSNYSADYFELLDYASLSLRK